jgi:serine/threonine-protein kinase
MLQPGEEVGCYIIQDYLDSGGMSKVFRARHKTEDTPVVVKEMIDQLQFDSQLVDRFVQSAKIMHQLRHPHLARVLDLIEQSGRYYVVEEYLPGGSLANITDRKDPISEQQALQWCRDALRGVDYAHQNGIIHRDLKPGNMMLDGEGKVKVTDFGIAKAFGGPRLTKTGAEMGTPAYMSPEQIRSPHHVDHLTDVYSMGVVLYELLTGEIPFGGETEFSIKEKVVREPPVPLRQRNAAISARAESLVLKAMQKDPSLRFGGCNEFALAIDAILTGRNNESKNNWRLVAAGAVGALLLIGVLFGVLRNSKSISPTEHPKTTPPVILEARPGESRTGSTGRVEAPTQEPLEPRVPRNSNDSAATNRIVETVLPPRSGSQPGPPNKPRNPGDSGPATSTFPNIPAADAPKPTAGALGSDAPKPTAGTLLLDVPKPAAATPTPKPTAGALGGDAPKPTAGTPLLDLPKPAAATPTPKPTAGTLGGDAPKPTAGTPPLDVPKPTAGTLSWTPNGRLEQRETTVTIESFGVVVNTGTVQGTLLPGTPVELTLSDTGHVSFMQTPSPSNGFSTIVLRVESRAKMPLLIKWKSLSNK